MSDVTKPEAGRILLHSYLHLLSKHKTQATAQCLFKQLEQNQGINIAKVETASRIPVCYSSVSVFQNSSIYTSAAL